MPKIVVRFSKKTGSVTLNDAIKLAEKCEHYTEGDYYFVHFTEPDNNLQKLLDLIKSLKATQVSLDDAEVDVRTLYNTVFCPDKLLCEGICTHPKIGWMGLSDFLERVQIEKGVGYVDEFGIQSLTQFLEKTGDKKFKLNKDKLLEYVKTEWFFELEHCSVINAKKTLDLVNKLPDTIEVRNRLDEQESDLNVPVEINPQIYKEIAEIFADAFEKRLRKVLKEFQKDKK